MNVRDLVPWGRTNDRAPSLYRDGDRDPFLALHREVNRLFDDAFRGFDMPFGRMSNWASSWPMVEMKDSDKDIQVVAEVPGLEEKDVEVLLEDGTLVLRGEKKAESEDKDRRISERFYGHFERRIPLGYEVQEDKVNATFNNGLLTVTLPKTEQAQSKSKRIAINGKQKQ